MTVPPFQKSILYNHNMLLREFQSRNTSRSPIKWFSLLDEDDQDVAFAYKIQSLYNSRLVVVFPEISSTY